tara:strand:- start:368 stop:1822 length:1455 start_codon:yes stop_codon:yes gene_type:complete
MASDYSWSTANVPGQVTESLKDVSKYITSSAGGWPNYKVGMLASYDFTIESGSLNPYIYEFNTNVACCWDAPLTPKINGLTNYLSSQSIDTLTVFGTYSSPNERNPSEAFYTKLSASLAPHNISCSLFLEVDYIIHGVHQGDEANLPDFSQQWAIRSGSNEYTLFVSSPYRYPELQKISSGSFNKYNFKGILGASPSSSLMIDVFDSSNASRRGDQPDYMIKRQQYDGNLLSGKLGFYSWDSDHYNSLSQSLSDNLWYGWYPLYEKFIVSSGSVPDTTNTYNHEYTQVFLHSHDEIVDLGLEHTTHKLVKKYDHEWNLIPSIVYRHVAVSGSEITLHDGSTKEIQNLSVGDNIRTFKINDLDEQSSKYATWWSGSLSGSVTASQVTRIDAKVIPAHHKVNNTYIFPDNVSRLMEQSSSVSASVNITSYHFTPVTGFQSTSKLVSSSLEPITISSREYVVEDRTFYAVETEGTDIIYLDDILVHS